LSDTLRRLEWSPEGLQLVDAVEKGFFSSERARLIQDQAPVRNVDSKKPLFSIRLLHFLFHSFRAVTFSTASTRSGRHRTARYFDDGRVIGSTSRI
jgi:hypothetical protein